MRIQFNLTLQSRLFLWFLPITLLPMIIGGCFMYYSVVENNITDTYFKLQSITDKKADQIDSFFQERKNDVITLAHIPRVIDLLSKHLQQPEDSIKSITDPGLIKYFQHHIDNYAVYDIIVATHFGDILLSTTNTFGDDANLISGPYRLRESPLAYAFTMALSSKKTSISNINFFRPSQNLALFVAAPVFDNGILLGAIIMQFSAETINALVSDYSALGASGEIGIATPILDEVIQVTSLRHKSGAAFNLRVSAGENGLLVSSTQDKHGFGEYIDYRGHNVFAAWKKLSQVDWGLRVKIDESEAMAPIITTFRWFIGIGIALIFFLSVIIKILSQKLLKPISELTFAANLLAQGGMHSKIIKVGDGQDELSILSRTFNLMAKELFNAHHQLQHSHDELEKKVEERTLELQIAKENAEKLQQQAESANDSKSRFLASMSHELRTPLTSIIGFTEIMKQQGNLTPQQEQHYISIIYENGEHLLALINDILNLAKIEANKANIEYSDVNLTEVIQSITDMVAPDIEKKGLELKINLSHTLPNFIVTDKNKLRQIITNLLSNAIKFTEQGQITLSISFTSQTQNKGLLYCNIEDTGQGISKQEMNDLFKPFSQTESGRKSTYGTGLGLSISQHFITLLKGNIFAESILGEGSIFRFAIPVDYSEPEQAPLSIPQQKSIKVAPNQANISVLIVDDIEAIRTLFTDHLEFRGITVFSAVNGKDAIQQFKNHKPDLILMDFLMPIMNGKEAVEAIRQLPDGGKDKVKIFMLTASVLDDKRSECICWGCDDILFKPLKINKLLSLIEQSLDVQLIDTPAPPFKNNKSTIKKITATQILALPSAWVSDFHTAAIEGDIVQLNLSLSNLPSTDSSLKEQLSFLINSYQFDFIEKITRQDYQNGIK